MASKWKPLAFFVIVLTLIAPETSNFPYLKRLSEVVQNAQSYPKSAINLSWFEFVARELGDESINVALVDMDNEADNNIPTKGNIVKVEFEHVDEAVQWSHLYPSWINEASAKCPEVPMPVLDKYEELDVVVARVSSNATGLKDVFKLQVNLVVANLLVRCGREQSGVSRPVFAVFIGPNGSMWEIFRCDDLVLQIGDSWIYKPQLRRMRQIVLMPVGSCQLNPMLPHLGEESNQPREAYATILHSTEAYVCGAIALAQSIIQTNTTKDLILLADDHISPESISALQSAGWQIKRIRRIRNPNSKKNSYNEWNYSKLRLWQLTGYDKLMFIDSDHIVTRNLDRFFAHPQISAAGNARDVFNSGLMLLEPSACAFETPMERIWAVRSYNGGDQGFLNEVFPWWHRLPKSVNRLKDFRREDERRFGEDVYAVHYLGLKPWWCYRDYDCNWDMEIKRRFASDSVHRRWWRVYDGMPEELRRFCALTPEMDKRIRKYRDLAKRGKFGDRHWRIEVKDPRQILL